MKSYLDYPKINNDRINFSKISGKLPLPNLVEIQTLSYENFLKKGIDEALKETFPIKSYDGKITISYTGFELEEPKYSCEECKKRDLTYQSKLNIKLLFEIIDEKDGKTNLMQIPHKSYIGIVPLMTESGTFIINGAERVIVSQIVRSPGAYLSKEMDIKSGKYSYGADLIPNRGTWLQFESDSNDLLWVRINRQRKMPATTLLKALGLENEKDYIDLFGNRDSLINTLKKDSNSSKDDALEDIFKHLKPAEPITKDGCINFLFQQFFDIKRYDLAVAGRFKFKKKLGIYNRLVGRVLAQNLENADGEVTYKKGTLLTKKMVDDLRDEEFFEKSPVAHTLKLNINKDLDKDDIDGIVNIVKVYADDKKEIVSNVIGTNLNVNANRTTISDIIALFSYFLNLMDGFGDVDDIDHLSNRRIRCVGELLNMNFKQGLAKMSKNAIQKLSTNEATIIKTIEEDKGKKRSEKKEVENEHPVLGSVFNVKNVSSAIKDFFAKSQLSQFMDQTNPLAELANKRRISALGQGGLKRDAASHEVRDVHFTHYGRICPIETPEGQNIGLINNLATYAKIDKYGFIQTPYRSVDSSKGDISDEVQYFSADEESNYTIAQATPEDIENDKLVIDDNIPARKNGKNVLATRKEVDYIDESPMQIVSIAAACIPFLENDDNTRALMGANMQRQALPLIKPHAPYVGTGIEHKIAHDCGLAIVACNSGTVSYVDSKKIIVKEKDGERTYNLTKFEGSNQGTCINQKSIVKVGDKVKKGDIIADGPAMENGDLALGQNVTIAFMTWEGYNYEDAVIMSDRLVKDDVYTTIHIESYDVECRTTKNGDESFTADVPNISKEDKSHLDYNGIVMVGTDVKEGDILVGKVTPKGTTEANPDEKLLEALFGDKSKDGKDTSLRVPHGGSGTVLDVKVFSRENGDELPADVFKKVRVYVVQKRKISEGDKMSGRHGNKGVISRIMPACDMPYLSDGTPVDILLNPQGVPSRMNIGQVLEVHLGMACKKLGLKIATPVFDGLTNEEVMNLMKESKMPSDGKYTLYDGRTGEKFDNKINVGVMYMIKLVHMVDDKLHARATGPYSMITQQPLGGKAQNGGQRFGEMEVWALEAYGAAYTLQEMMTLKSDDRVGRRKAYESIIKGNSLPKASMPEAFKVLTKELMGLCLDVELKDENNEVIDMDALARQAQKEESRSIRSVRDMGKDSLYSEEDELHEKTEEEDEKESILDNSETTNDIVNSMLGDD